jgi:hypothetical protein
MSMFLNLVLIWKFFWQDVVENIDADAIAGVMFMALCLLFTHQSIQFLFSIHRNWL